MKHFFSILILTLLSLSAKAQTYSSTAQTYKLYTSDVELPSALVHDIFQDHTGVVWIATEDGLTRFDGVKFYTYKFNKQTGSLTSEMTKDETNGTLYYTNTIALQFTRLEGEKHFEIEALSRGQLSVIVLDNNGKYWFVGYDGYVSAANTTAQSGQSFDDLSGYNTTMSAMSAHLPFEITKATFDSLPIEAAPVEAE